MVTLSNLTTKIVRGQAKTSDPVTSVSYTQFRKVAHHNSYWPRNTYVILKVAEEVAGSQTTSPFYSHTLMTNLYQQGGCISEAWISEVPL